MFLIDPTRTMLRITARYTVFPFVTLEFINITNYPIVLCQATAEPFLNANLCSGQSNSSIRIPCMRSVTEIKHSQILKYINFPNVGAHTITEMS